MTKKEKELIKKAIRLIHHDSEYYTGMDILAKLVGWPTVHDDIVGKIKTKSVTDFMRDMEAK